MACFIVPAAEAAVVTVLAKRAEIRETGKREKELENKYGAKRRITAEKLGLLSRLLWGGSVLLAFEHLWHGELVPYFPFLTAMYHAKDAVVMLKEMGTVGVAMALCVTAAWAVFIRFRRDAAETENRMEEVR